VVGWKVAGARRAILDILDICIGCGKR